MSRWLVWNVLFPLHERLKGHRTYEILREMEAADSMTATELAALTSAKLSDLIHYCYANVPYIRKRMDEAGLQPSQIQSPEDLVRLPVMTKDDVRKYRDDLRTRSPAKIVAFSTGGSTGTPLIFDLAKRRVAARIACRQRVNRWWGIQAGDPEISLWGSPLEVSKQDWLRNVRDRLLKTRLLSAYEMSEDSASKYLNMIERSGCREIFTYPSSIYFLCLCAKRQGRNLRRLGVKVIFVTSEVLYPHQRDLITETFNCPVANGYGGRDSGFISHECPQLGMHILSDAVIAEVVDPSGRPVPHGEPGEIVVTDLYSHEVPFIRYSTGDRGALSSRRCPCGRPLPLFERIDGRSNDYIVTPDGRVMHAQSLICFLGETEGIEEFRISQKSLDTIHVEIVRNEYYQIESEQRLRENWVKRLRAPIQITFEYLPSMPRDRSGKFRHVVSEITGVKALAQ